MATSNRPESIAANSRVNGPIVLAWDSTVTAANGAASSARRGTSSRGTAWRSKKLLALYNFSRWRLSRLSRLSRTCRSCAGSAPGGVGPSRVQRHRSQNEQVNGHSAPARNTVRARSNAPCAARSSSSTVPCALSGWTWGFGGRSPRIRVSGVEGVEMPAITRLVLGENRARAMLEPALGVGRHLDPEYRAHASAHDLALQRIEALMRALRQLGERNRLGDTDDRRTSVRTESNKP